MSVFIHFTKDLLPPLYCVDERMYHIRKGSTLTSVPSDPTIVFFLEANHELLLGDTPPIRVQAGDICIFPPKMMRSYRQIKKSPACQMHAFRLVLRFNNQHPSTEVNQFIQQAVSNFRYLPNCISPNVHERIALFRHESENVQVGYQLKISTMWLDFIADCAREYLPSTQKTLQVLSSKADILIERTKAFILDNHHKPITLDEIAWQAKVSREHLARTFKQQTGNTVFEYLLSVRIGFAQQFLADSAKSIGEVARLCGFSSPTLFGRTFKRQTGFTPMAYRQSILSKSHSARSILD